jgi:sugar phosphate isomerase/epimerase
MKESKLSRRQLLLALAGGAFPFLGGCRLPTGASGKRTGMGIVTYSFNIHQKNQWAGRYQGMTPALAFLEECHRLGAGGIQFPVGPEDASSLPEIQSRADAYGMRVEGIVNMPAGKDQLDTFEQSLNWAAKAGATLARTTVIPGRRYEQFKTLEEFHDAENRALKSLQLVEPVLARHRFRLAVENHKDQLVSEKLRLLRQLGSEYIGLCVDVGNNIALAEEPLSVIRELAPFAFTVHIKDHIATPYSEGYLLWDAALGEGFLNLGDMAKILRKASPLVPLNLEVITRDPLKIPIHTDEYWVTLPGRRESALSWIEQMVKNSPSSSQPPLSGLTAAQQMAVELHNCETSLRYARERLKI